MCVEIFGAALNSPAKANPNPIDNLSGKVYIIRATAGDGVLKPALGGRGRESFQDPGAIEA